MSNKTIKDIENKLNDTHKILDLLGLQLAAKVSKEGDLNPTKENQELNKKITQYKTMVNELNADLRLLLQQLKQIESQNQ